MLETDSRERASTKSKSIGLHIWIENVAYFWKRFREHSRQSFWAPCCAMPTEMKDKKNSNPERKICGKCSATEGSEIAPRLRSCSRCGLVFYCSRDCQRAHWTDHKQTCIPKADRAPQHQKAVDVSLGAASDAGVAGEMCAICQDTLASGPACTLPCTHVFHSTCVAELRKLGVQQACPLCRTNLPPGPEKVFEEATRRYTVVHQMVERGRASWHALPKWAQEEVDAAIVGWTATAEDGAAGAQFNMGIIFHEGHGVAKSYEEAFRWFKRAADQGLAEAQFRLGGMLAEGRGVAQSDKEAVYWYRKAANQDDSEAQCNLGKLLEEDRSLARSDTEAIHWYKKAANQGDTDAQCNLGVLLKEGRGVAANDIEAARWTKKAADRGHAAAQVNLGLLFKEGRGVAQSDVEAVRWYKKAVNQGYANGQFNLGIIFEEGRGVVQSDTEAVLWYRKAADQGDVGAHVNLGSMFLEGRGVAQNDLEAARWFRKAAEQGNTCALANMGSMYMEGRGVE